MSTSALHPVQSLIKARCAAVKVPRPPGMLRGPNKARNGSPGAASWARPPDCMVAIPWASLTVRANMSVVDKKKKLFKKKEKHL